jgi:hypothetical protein
VDKKTFSERVARLEEIAAVLQKLPAEVRSQAFDVLAPYATGGKATSSEKPKPNDSVRKPDDDDPDTERAEFFGAFDHDKPSDNLKLVAAYLYSQHGSTPFTAEELKTLADDVGITVPERIDMTLRQATVDGKSLFNNPSRGQFKPTVHGEAYMKKQYKVKKGKKPKPVTSE